MKTKRRAPTNMVLTASAVPSKEIAILNGKQGLEILRRKCMYVCMYESILMYLFIYLCIYVYICMYVCMYILMRDDPSG